MNVAKNKKTVLQSIFEILSKLSDDKKKDFENYAKLKRETPKYLSLYHLINKLIKSGEIIEALNEPKFKKELEKGKELTTSATKLAENLYEKLIAFITNEFKKNEWKQWQIEANQKLLETEALFSNELYSQAAAHILKLEEMLKHKGDYTKWRYDDIGIYTRLANLKVNLMIWNKGLYECDEMDILLHNLLQTGWYFYNNNNLNHSNMHSFEKHKQIGYQLLAKYFIENENLSLAIHAIENEIEILKKTSDQEKEKETKLLINFWNLYKFFIVIKNDLSKISYDYKLSDGFRKNDDFLLYMLFEQLIFDIQLSFGLISNDTKVLKELADKENPYGLLFYASHKIENFEIRKELNHCIVLYLIGKYDACLSLIKEIKKIGKVVSRDNPIYYKVLFIELLANLKYKDYVQDDLIRSLKGILKVNTFLDFEGNAIKLMDKFTKEYFFGLAVFIEKHRKDLNDLERSKLEIEPLHHLILNFFKT